MTESEYEKLLNTASQKMGSSPEALRRTLEKGDVAALSKGLTKEDKAKLKEVLQNKELMKMLKNASSPAEIMKMLGGK